MIKVIQDSIIETKWRSIDTAPKDGTKILLWLRNPWSRAEIARWDDEIKAWTDRVGSLDPDADFDGIGSLVPSHWMPIIPPAAD